MIRLTGLLRPDLTVVVVNNDGGGIFSFLPCAGMNQFEKPFGTTHGVDFAHIAAATGWGYQRVANADELSAARKDCGTRLVEGQTDRRAGVALRDRCATHSQRWYGLRCNVSNG